MRIEPFAVDVSNEVLQDLDARLRKTRWPESAPGAPWEQGGDRAYLQALLDYWTHGFDWRAQERMLNSFEYFRAGFDGVSIHFVHARARHGDGIPFDSQPWMAEHLRRDVALGAAAYRPARPRN